jgi:hypothetical protein
MAPPGHDEEPLAVPRHCGWTSQPAVLAGSAARYRSAPWPENPLGRRRVDREQAGRPDRATDELAAAVRAYAAQDVLRAVAAPGALVGADEHVRGGRVQVPVTAFAIRPQLQHTTSIGRQPQPGNSSGGGGPDAPDAGFYAVAVNGGARGFAYPG